jgi:peptide/nickel transport system permease protein
VAVAIIAFFTVIAVAAPYVPGIDPFATTNRPLEPPSSRHWMGTDDLGRDVFSEFVWGARVSLAVGFICAIAATALGILVGAAAGVRAGWLDDVLMRATDVCMTIPRLLLAVVVVAVMGAGLWNIVFAITGLSWPATARLVRGEFLSLRHRDFVEAARSLGQPEWRVVLRAILPNSLPPVIVNVSLEVGAAIVLEAGLSFLGLGDPTRVSWGIILNNAQRFIDQAWWMSVFPGTAIFLTVLAFSLLGDALSDALDPRLHGR